MTPPTPTPAAAPSNTSRLPTIPAPLRALFSAFPLLTLPATPLPARSPRPSQTPTLHIFTTSPTTPSHNPACLKWQTFLRLHRVPHSVVASTNHASPTGTLPFLSHTHGIVPAHKIRDWAAVPEDVDTEDVEVAAFLTLLDTYIRDAWLYALYLEPANSAALSLYAPTSVSFVNYALLREYKEAAERELLKTRAVVSADEVYADAQAGWEALEAVLGGDEWFFGAGGPGLVDAAVFAYTQLVGGLVEGGRGGRLRRGLEKCGGLVGHRERVRARCWGEK